jgi:TonB-linked SusC/RagA family outer membrane protein
MKKLSLIVFVLLGTLVTLSAQKTVSGTVIDSNKDPIIGATVLVQGTSTGVITDVDGKYSLNVPAGKNTLLFTYVGYTDKTVDVTNLTTVDVELAQGQILDEVVVTGLGIAKEKKSLGYAVTTIGSADIELRPEADVARVLRGKVAGVDISQTSGLAGSGTNVIIRGYSSISGTNQPLFIVDGVPFNSDTNNDRGFDSGGATASSRFLDLDPNNIKEVSVLKGLSATVLYGEAGRNGVVLISTKGGTLSDNVRKKNEITVDQQMFRTQVASRPEVQQSYGNGFYNTASQAFSNWGAPFASPGKYGVAADGTIAHPYGRSNLNSVLPQYVGARYQYKPYDNLGQFFENGLILNTSVNITKSLGDNTSINLNYGYRNEDSFVPLSDYSKNNFGLGVSTKLSNGIKINGTFNYIKSGKTAPPAGVSFSSNPTGASLFSNIFYTPISIDLYGLEYENPADKSSIFYRGGNDIQHPLWTLNNAGDKEVVSRFFNTVSASYDVNSWLNVMYRLGLDNYTTSNNFFVNKGGQQIQGGSYSTIERRNTILNHDFLLNYNKSIAKDFTIDGVVGLTIRKDSRDFEGTYSSQQFVYGLLTHNNFINTNASTGKSRELLYGLFGTTTLGYKNYLYLNLQARNDWTSTLESANRSILYPSASLSFIATDAIAALQNNKWINFGKLRIGYGTSAGYPNPYQTRNILSSGTRSFITESGQILNTNSINNNFGNPNLAPELHKELEFGLEGRFIDNRLSVDLSMYNKVSSDLIIDRLLDPSTGGTNTTVNAAQITNKGIELALGFDVIRNKSINWKLSGNFTKNVGIVNQLAEGIQELVISGYTNLGNFAIPGEQYGIIKGTKLIRNDNGDAILDGVGGYRPSPTLGVLGNPNPNYTLNGGTELTIKGVTINALFSYSDGGAIYSTLPSTLMGRGILKETDFDRFVPVVIPGVRADGTKNTLQMPSTEYYWNNGGVFHDELRVYDATYLKLREISISYGLPKSLLKNSPFGAVRMQLSGQNLWFNAFGFPPGANFDPEVLSLGVGNGRGFELMNVPTAKQFGGSLRVTF